MSSNDLGNTNKNHQELLIAHLKRLINEAHRFLEPKLTGYNSNKILHLRTEIRGRDPLDYLNSLTNRSLKDAQIENPTSMSSEADYTTRVLETTKVIVDEEGNRIPSRTRIYYLNTVKTKDTATFNRNTKALTPAKFNLNGKTIHESRLKNRIIQAFNDINSPANDTNYKIADFCKALIEQINDSPPKNNQNLNFNNIRKFSKEEIEEINNSDINVVAKNFGEILGALWYMKTDPDDNSVYYPNKENEPLIDYKVYTNENNKVISSTSVSAKSKAGAASSISGLHSTDDIDDSSTIESTETLNPEEEKLKNFLISNKNEKIPQKIFNTNRILINDDNPIKELKKLMSNNKQLTLDEINNYLFDIKDYEDAISKLKPFYDTCKYDYTNSLSKSILTKIFARSSGSKLGAIIYPLGIHAAREMNKNKNWLNFLNRVIKGKKIIQVNIYLTKKRIKFVKNDVNAENNKKVYEFVYNGMAADENNRGMSFKLKGKQG